MKSNMEVYEIMKQVFKRAHAPLSPDQEVLLAGGLSVWLEEARKAGYQQAKQDHLDTLREIYRNG